MAAMDLTAGGAHADAMQKLKSGHRYIVAIRDIQSTKTGLPVEASPAFASLRDSACEDDHEMK